MSRFLSTNTGPVDRGIRVALGLALLTLTFAGPKTPWGFVGLLPLITGLVGVCPAYSIFGFSTCPAPAKKGQR
jgi:hypothetical protein